MKNTKQEKIKKNIKNIISIFEPNLKREGLVETPKRYAKMILELLAGYNQDTKKLYKTFLSNGNKNLITISNIKFNSLCEHHLLPFFGSVEISYIPKGKILGLSKFGRIVDVYAKRLQIQERLTEQIAKDIFRNLKPQYISVEIKAKHLCVNIRGVKKDGCCCTTFFELGKKH